MAYTFTLLNDGGNSPLFSHQFNSDYIYSWREATDYTGYELIKRHTGTGAIALSSPIYSYTDTPIYGDAFANYSNPAYTDWANGMLGVAPGGDYIFLSTYASNEGAAGITVWDTATLNVVEHLIVATGLSDSRRGGISAMSGDGVYYARSGDRRFSGSNYASSYIAMFKYNGGTSPVYNYFDLNDIGITDWVDGIVFDSSGYLWAVCTVRAFTSGATITGNSKLHKLSVDSSTCALTLVDSWTISDYSLRTGANWDTYYHYFGMTYNSAADKIYLWSQGNDEDANGDSQGWFQMWDVALETMSGITDFTVGSLESVDENNWSSKIGWSQNTKYVCWLGNGNPSKFELFDVNTLSATGYLDTLWDDTDLGGLTFWEIRPGNTIFYNQTSNAILAMGGNNVINPSSPFNATDLLFELGDAYAPAGTGRRFVAAIKPI